MFNVCIKISAIVAPQNVRFIALHSVLLQEASGLYIKVRLKKTRGDVSWQEKHGRLTSSPVHSSKPVFWITQFNKLNFI